jgi:serine protease AprX
MRRTPALIAFVVLALASTPGKPAAQRGPTLSADLHALQGRSGRVRVIVQADDSAIRTIRGRLRGMLHRDLGGALALDVTRDEFERLTRDSSIAHLSGDLPVAADMAITNRITAAASVWQGSPGLLGLLSTPGYNGSGIGVAIVDSGIAPHSAIGDRIVARVNMVSWEPDAAGDAFGHGTHIAGAVAGSATAARYVTSAYGGGSAPGVRLVDVRVLGRTGVGLTSDVIAGIDWAVANRTRYGIRIITLALGHPVSEPAATDPLCRAVARAAAAGIVVVASAGNYGQTAEGARILGGITSPGNSPAAITVGAIDPNGTIDRRDDRVADFSSRGPTRFDMAVKPDVVAPGTRLVSLEAQNSYLSSAFPQWHIAGTGRNAYMRLSGTSMATGVVAGGAALLLDASPELTPAQVKLALQMGATYVKDGGLIGGGAGTVDFAASMRIAKTGLVPSLLTTVDSLLGTSSGAAFDDTGTLIGRVYDRTGVRLLGVLDLAALFGTADDAERGVLHLLGLSNPLASLPANHLVWGEVAGWTSSYYLVWGNAIQDPSGQYLVWGNTDYTGSSYLVWGNMASPSEVRRR